MWGSTDALSPSCLNHPLYRPTSAKGWASAEWIIQLFYTTSPACHQLEETVVTRNPARSVTAGSPHKAPRATPFGAAFGSSKALHALHWGLGCGGNRLALCTGCDPPACAAVLWTVPTTEHEEWGRPPPWRKAGCRGRWYLPDCAETCAGGKAPEVPSRHVSCSWT